MKTLLKILSLFAAINAQAQNQPKPLWDNWYTITITQGKKSIPYGTLNEKAEIKEDRVVVQTRIIKSEEGHLNEETIGSFAKNTPKLEPLFFTSVTKYRASETVVDGTFQPSGKLVLKSGGKSQDVAVSAGAILINHFPVWLGKNLDSIKKTKKSFRAWNEASIGPGARTLNGSAKALPADDFAKSKGLTLVEVEFEGQKSKWWVRPDGSAAKIDYPQDGRRVDQVSKNEAESFLAPQ